MASSRVTARKKKWIDMEITRVRLNPEQAVMACCSVRTRRNSTFTTFNFRLQCSGYGGCGSGGAPMQDQRS